MYVMQGVNLKKSLTSNQGPPVTFACPAVTLMTTQHETTTVSRAAVLDLVVTSIEMGILSKNELHALNHSVDTSNEQTDRVPESRLISLWNKISASKSGHGFGLRLGQTINPESKGLLASWVSQAETLREALDIFCKNIPLMNPSESWLLEENVNSSALTLRIDQHKAYPDIAIERSMSAMVAWGSTLSGAPFTLQRAEFSFSTPLYEDMFTAIFGSNISFNCNHNRLFFNSTLLDQNIVSSNQLLKGMIEHKAKQALIELNKNTAAKNKVTSLINSALSKGNIITVSQVCAALATNRQTLYRQLKRDNTDFKSLYDNARKEHAFAMLTKGTESITALSFHLGYKDTSSFYKAFKRWSGMSPSEYVLSVQPNYKR